MPRPRLSTGRRVRAVPSSARPAVARVDTPIVRVDPPARIGRRVARRALIVAGFLTAVAAVLYVTLAATVLFVAPVGSRYLLVLRGVYPVGQVPAGSVVYVSNQPVDYSPLGKLRAAFLGVPAGSVVDIVAGPVGAVGDSHGVITVDGRPTRFRGTVTSRVLADTYLARCVRGACQAGGLVLIPQNDVLGAARGYLGAPVTVPTAPGGRRL